MQEGIGILPMVDGRLSIYQWEEKIVKVMGDKDEVPSVCSLFQLLSYQEKYVIRKYQVHDSTFG